MFQRGVTKKIKFVPVCLDEKDPPAPSGGGGLSAEDVKKLIKDAVAPYEQKLEEMGKELEAEQGLREQTEDMLIEAAGGEKAISHFMETGELPDDDSGGWKEGYEGDDGDDEGYVLVDADGNEFGIEGADDAESLIRGIQKRAGARVESLEKKLQKEIDRREELEQTDLENQRDRLLADALVANDVVDVKAGLKLFKDQMEFDPDERSWKFKSEEGLYMEPGAGLAEALPDYLRKPMSGSGGSGSRGSSPSAIQSQLSSKKEALDGLHKRAAASGDQRDISAWQKLSREVKELETQNRPGAAVS